MSEYLQPVLRVLNTSESVEEFEANFRRSISELIVQKYDGDVFAYIKNLHETIDTLESNMDNMADAYLHEDAA